jgi:hypothetical protein
MYQTITNISRTSREKGHWDANRSLFDSFQIDSLLPGDAGDAGDATFKLRINEEDALIVYMYCF